MSDLAAPIKTTAKPIPPATTAMAHHQPPTAALMMGQKGVELRTFDDLVRFSDALHKSGMAPKDMNQAAIIVSIQWGSELGISPMSSVQNIAVINGRPCLWGDLLLAICMAANVFDPDGWKEYFEGGDLWLKEKDKNGNLLPNPDFRAVCVSKRRNFAAAIERSYSVADAIQARLWGKPGTWQTNPKRMLQMRARGFNLRDNFPDVTKGVYVREELDEIETRPQAAPLLPPQRFVVESVTNEAGGEAVAKEAAAK